MFIKSAFDIGKTGSAEKFLKKLKSTKSYGYQTQAKNDALLKGAAEAFHEGRPENIQIAMSNAQSLGDRGWGILYDFRCSIFSILLKGRNDQAADIDLALEKLSPQDRKKLLNSTLHDAVSLVGQEDLIPILLNAGADANARIKNNQGDILVAAATRGATFPVIKLLHEHGASFDDALNTMSTGSYTLENIEKLKLVRTRLRAQPESETKPTTSAPTDIQDLRDKMERLQEQVDLITKRLPPLQEAPSTPPPPKRTFHPIKRI
jgi:hypothetical protein